MTASLAVAACENGGRQ